MADPAWLRSMVFPGESGGDYGALFGYANRPGGAFEGVDLTKMTVNDVIQFTDPSGPYAQWVKGQLGYVATPTGGYQVVGSTLRDAVKSMGLTGNEMYDPATQDAIGQWIYANQGPGAWEAWGKGGGGGGGPAVTASAKGGGTMGLLEVPQQDPSGLVGLLTGEQKPWAGKLNDIGAVLLALSGSPAAQPLMEQLNKRKDAAREDARMNKTAQWLAGLGRDDLAQAVMAGSLSGSDAAAIAMTPAATPEPTKGVEVDGKIVDPVTGKVIYDGGPAEPEFKRATPEEAAAYGATAGQFGPDGRFYPIDVPQGMTIESDGQGGFRMVQGPAGAGGKGGFTEAQSKDVVFSTRAKGALERLEPVADALTSRGDVVADFLPLGLGGSFQSEEYQVAKTAGQEFLQAILRKDTGAAITEDEQRLYGETYLPQPGDTPERLAYKAEARKRAVAALDASMTPAQILAQEKALASGEVPPQASGDLTVGTVEDGYRYLGGDPSLPTSWEAVQ